MYTLDTNAIIYYIKNDNDTVSFFRSILDQETLMYVSAMTEIELFKFPNLSFVEAEIIENLLATTIIINIDSRIARLAASLCRYHNLKLPDSVIAATALFTKSTLITRNIRDFQKIPHLSLRKI